MRGAHAYVADVDGLSTYALEGGGARAVGHLETPGAARDLAWSGERLCLADGAGGLSFFDLGDPAAPRPVGRVEVPRAVRRLAGGAHGLAALTEGDDVVLLRPGALVPEVLALPGDLRALAWVGPHLYVAASGHGLVRLDASGGPLRVGDHDPARRWALSLAAQGDRLWVGTADKRVTVLDVSDPRGRRPLGGVDLDREPTRIDVLGEWALVSAVGFDGAPEHGVLLELSPALVPRPRGELSFAARPALHEPPERVERLGSQAAALVAPGRALLALGPGGLAVLDLDARPQVRAVLPGARVDRLRSDGRDLLVGWGPEALVAFRLEPGAGTLRPAGQVRPGPLDATPCAPGWCVLDARGRLCELATGAAPPAAGACSAPSSARVAVAAEPGARRLWSLGVTGGLEAWPPAPPWQPLATFEPAWARGRPAFDRLLVEGGLAVALDALQGVLHAFDVGARAGDEGGGAPGPFRPRDEFLLQARPADLALFGRQALVAEPSAGLQVIDLSEPGRPRERAWLPLVPGPRAVAVRPGRGGEALVALAQGEAGLSLWAWDGRGSFEPRGRVETPGLAGGLAFVGDALWAADGTGLVRVDLEAP